MISLTGIVICLLIFFTRLYPEHAPPPKMNGTHAGDMYVIYGINNYSIENDIF